LLVIDLAQDTATFDAPTRFPLGIEHVFINGQHVLDGDRYDGQARAGIVIRD
jgi:hypothetical protein